MRQLNLFREIIVDNFAGGGGASTGIELATGLSVDIAINHDPEAIAMHQVNHPDTEHYCESVWDVDPREVSKGRPIGLAWFSPDCKHFSKAKGGKPVEKSIRGLAWVAVRWAATVAPRVIILENVEEFQTWGPLTTDGRPDPNKKGNTFRSFIKALNSHGYKVEWKELRACDYGAPTIRKRLFLIARRDGRPIIWPEPTHGDPKSIEVKAGKLKSWRSAAEVMDWSIDTPSIFNRKRPLAENTIRRIIRGIQRFVINSTDPFVIETFASHGDNNERRIATSHLIKLRGTCRDGQTVTKPLPTITAGGLHVGEVRAFLTKYYGSDTGQTLNDPLHTITTKDRFGLVTIKGKNFRITDIGMRMLQPHELFAAQGFPKDYVIDKDINGVRYPKTQQVARCGNAVPPPFAEHLVRANLPELCLNEHVNIFSRLKAN
ncbi:DNA cytosine methyltransferase [Bacillus rugosus]|uniref:DNA cytosine methyltransferase n=1 Tax=Bacillus TaxID=1386 RepID=UPI000849F43A|nr:MULTISPECIES: DNA cytosine methyltransferase [Bacillus]MEC3664960.1 DNA cytosine methyltransferase [Bacillus subtilis]NUF07811.1 DNA cytosine methyltransferase [Bacillus rugosus]ODV48135.1 DNA methyltransferase [Bacillus subtilis]OJH64092.1 DNA cytosine methyltransferase [Bacillus subtilis]